MGSVINQKVEETLATAGPPRVRRDRFPVRKIKLLILLFYVVAIPVYIAIGLQPSSNSAAETFTTESGTATGYLIIDSINLSTPVSAITLENRTLKVPDYIVGSFSANPGKILLVGHSSTVFENLKNVDFGDVVDYNDFSYRITNIETRAKESISMNKILDSSMTDTLVLMTCTGESLGDNDYTHRLIITAERV